MNTPDEKQNAIEMVSKQLVSLAELLSRAKSTNDAQLGREQLRRWKDQTVQLLAEKVSESESRVLSEKRLGSVMRGQPL